MSARPKAVVLCLSPTGLSVARSLAPRGIEVWGVDSDPWEIGHFSRWVRHHPEFSRLPPGPELRDRLVAWGRQQDCPPVLFCAGDPWVDFAAEHHEALRSAFVLPGSVRPEVASLLVDKEAFYRRCQQLGVAMAPTWFPSTREEAEEAARSLRYPAIVKPTHGHLFRKLLNGNKLIECDGPDELVQWWQKLHDWGGRSVLQEVIPGPEASIFVCALYAGADFRARSLMTARKDRQYPPMYGSGSFMEARWSPEIAELSRSLIEKLGYHGVCGTEYKWDERDAEWKLIEVNARPTLWYALSRAAGVDVVWDAYCDLAGAPNPDHIGGQRDGTRWQLLARDLPSAWHFLSRGELAPTTLARQLLDPRQRTWAVLSARDPGCVAVYPFHSALRFFTHRLGWGAPSQESP